MNLVEYAEHSGRSKQLISRWVKPGGLLEKACRRNGRKVEIDVEMADTLIEMTLDKSKSRKHSPQTKAFTGTYQDALTKDKYYAAALKKLKLDREKGLLVLKVAVEKESFECARQVRDAILNIPSRIAPILAAEKAESKVEKMLVSELTQALEGLAA